MYSNLLFEKWGIHNWKEYIGTLFWIANQTNKYRVENRKGMAVLNLDTLIDETGLISKSLINALSINENDHLPYITNAKDRNNNDDYRFFRSNPLIKLDEGEKFVVANIQFISERIFNSLFFDFKPFISDKKKGFGIVDFNKDFIEKHLFKEAVRKCFKDGSFCYPATDNNAKEDIYEPDFYCREGTDIYVFECKAIKMNGTIKDDGDFHRLIDELHEKIVLTTKQLDPNLKVNQNKARNHGIGQLIYHIKSIEDDTFHWDNNIPDQIRYYPILVLEDPKLIQPGLFSITNKWYQDEIKRQGLNLDEIASSPLITMSIASFYKYEETIRMKGLCNLIDKFEKEATSTDKNGNKNFSIIASFDKFLTRYKPTVNNEIKEWLLSK